MWKIGPECAAQQAKWASASATNCGVRSASPALRRRSGHGGDRRRDAGRGRGWGDVEHDRRAADQQRRRHISSVATMPTTSIAGRQS